MSLGKEKDKYFFILLYIWKKIILSQTTDHFYSDIYAFTLQLGWSFLKMDNDPVELGRWDLVLH